MMRVVVPILICCSLLCCATALPAKLEQRGITFTNGKYCPNVTYATEKSDLSLRNLASTGANYVSVVVTQYQHTYNSTDIFPIWEPRPSGYYTYVTASDAELQHVIASAHELGLKVMLKPHIDLINDPAHWRGDIGSDFTEQQWSEWFHNYDRMLLRYAELAQGSGVEQLSLGCELIATSKRDAQWRSTVAQVRKVFDGAVTDSANWGWLNATGGEETNKTWWDAVDYIGVDAYYPILPDDPNPTLPQVITALQPVVQRLRNVSQHNHWKPLLITEIGYCSPDCQRSGGKPSSVDMHFQAVHYQGIFEAFAEEHEWFKGVFWWAWNTDPAFGGLEDRCISPQWKPSQDVLREYYDGGHLPEPVRPSYGAVCACTV